MKVLNIKTIPKDTKLKKPVAYCGNNKAYWETIFPVIKQMEDYSVLGKPKALIVRGNREKTIANYREYAKIQMNINPQFKAHIIALHTNRIRFIACWCKPLACHCDVIAELVEESIDMNFEDIGSMDDDFSWES